MAKAPAHVGIVYNKIRDLIRGRAEIFAPPTGQPQANALCQPGNLVEYSSGRPGDPKLAAAAPADFPQIHLRPGPGGDSLFSDSPTFDREDATFSTQTSEWTEPVQQTYQILIVGRDHAFTPVEQLRAECLTALRNAGPRLGLGQWVLMQKATWKFELTGRLPECKGAIRWTCTVTVQFQFDFEGATDLIVK